jgi:ribulose-bisphosphate carboxylase large chain
MTRFAATYWIETPGPLEKAADTLAAEQSSGTFVAVPGETDALKQRHAARVEKIEPLDVVSTPSLPGPTSGSVFRRARVTVSWPLENVGSNLPALVSTVQGNLYEIRAFTGLRLLSLDLPSEFTKHFRGPKYGIDGTRSALRSATSSQRASDDSSRGLPLIGTIIKPSVGLSPAQTAEMVKTLVEAGIDFIKDDELMTSPPHSAFNERFKAVIDVVNRHADKTGKRTLYACNITDELDAMKRNYETVINAGGVCAMVSINAVGLVATKAICDLGALVIHGHRNGWGMLTRSPALGMDFAAYQALWRLAGIDQLHVNGIANKFWESDDSVVASIAACHAPMHNLAKLLPVVSSGQTGLQAPETYRRTQTTDLLYLAGGGIAAHPSGAHAGVLALRQAWQAAIEGIPLDEYARTHSELRQQIEKFGARS